MSRIPLILDYLVDQLGPLVSAAGFAVADGPPGQAPAGVTKALIIGGSYQPAEVARPSATSVVTVGPGSSSDYEAVSIGCQVFSQTGDSDGLRDRRTEAFEVLGIIRAYLVGDRTLGGLSQGDTRIGAVDDTRPVRNTRGVGCVVDFTITTTVLLWDG